MGNEQRPGCNPFGRFMKDQGGNLRGRTPHSKEIVLELPLPPLPGVGSIVLEVTRHASVNKDPKTGIEKRRTRFYTFHIR